MRSTDSSIRVWAFWSKGTPGLPTRSTPWIRDATFLISSITAASFVACASRSKLWPLFCCVICRGPPPVITALSSICRNSSVVRNYCDFPSLDVLIATSDPRPVAGLRRTPIAGLPAPGFHPPKRTPTTGFGPPRPAGLEARDCRQQSIPDSFVRHEGQHPLDNVFLRVFPEMMQLLVAHRVPRHRVDGDDVLAVEI